MIGLCGVRKLTSVTMSVPDVERPVKASLAVSVADVSNAWDLWLFPKGPSHAEIVADAAKRGVAVAEAGSDAAKAAIGRGDNLISIAGAGGKENVRLGWWNMGTQVGTAIKEHPALAGIPHDGTMSPLFFRLVKDTGLPLPAEGISPDEMIIVGEGGEKCFCYLAERKEGGSRLLECHGLDLVSDTPEGNAVLRSFVDYLAK